MFPQFKYLFSLSNLVQSINHLIQDLSLQTNSKPINNQYSYTIVASEPVSITRSARILALKQFKSSKSSFKKIAFDTRRYNQETTYNPRTNCQDWHRTDPFLDPDIEHQISLFAKLLPPLEQIKNKFGAQPEYFQSYARNLYDQVHRILRIKEGDLDIFKPQINYLEQLLLNRYQLTLNDLDNRSTDQLLEAILHKDEALTKKGLLLSLTSQSQPILKDGQNDLTQQNIVNAIFGQNLRPNGEKTVIRQITITIRDSVED